MSVTIRSVDAEITRPLRHQVLRPHQDLSHTSYPGDDHPDSLHMAAYVEDELVGVSSIYPQDFDEVFKAGPWRIRGMAVLPAYRRQNIGRQLLLAGIDYARAKGGSFMWCNARTTASAFYFKLGFLQDGAEFELPGIGPHYRLKLPL